MLPIHCTAASDDDSGDVAFDDNDDKKYIRLDHIKPY